MLALLALVFLIQPPKAPGQNQYAVTGKWDFLYHGYYDSPFDYMEGTTLNPRPVRWRERHWGFTTSLFAPYNDTSSLFRDFESAESVSLSGARERAREIRDTFGVHAVLLPGRLTLPESGGQQAPSPSTRSSPSLARGM